MTTAVGSRRALGAGLCHWRVWGATVSLGVTDLSTLTRARRRVEEEIAGVDRTCNRFVPTSDLSRVNRGAGSWVPVAPPFLDALDVALAAATSTAGAVDPTVGAALLGLGYDRDFDELTAGGPASVQRPGEPGPVAGWRAVEVDRSRHRVRIPPGAALDLGATAKALCVDRAAKAVADLGIGVLVDIGGDLAVAGPVPAGGWPVTVQESSRSPLDDAAPVVAVSQGGLATSGTTVRAWHHRGRLVHHLVDPGTGEPAVSPWRMVTVAAPTCVEANVAATAAVVRGGTALSELARQGLPARLVDRGGRATVVGGWPADAAPGSHHDHPRPPEGSPT